VSYRFLDDIAPADVAFEAVAEDPAGLLVAAWEATLSVMVEPPSSVRPRVRREVRIEATDMEALLFDTLAHQIYTKDAEGLLLRLAHARVLQRPGGALLLEARAEGESIDPARHRLGVDVKAVTYHRFAVRRVGARWKATVVLDL
jgi:SHS2 domain-containing protein